MFSSPPFCSFSSQKKNWTIRWWRRLALRSVTQKKITTKQKKKFANKAHKWYFCSVFTFSIQISFACSNIVGYKQKFRVSSWVLLSSFYTAYLSTFFFFVNEFNDFTYVYSLLCRFGHSIKNVLWWSNLINDMLWLS